MADTHTHEHGSIDYTHPSVATDITTTPDRRKTYGNGRIRALGKRLSPHQQAKREGKIVARRVVAEALAEHVVQTRLALGFELAKSLKRQQRLERGLIALGVVVLALIAYVVLQ